MLHRIKTNSFQLQVPLTGKVLTLQQRGYTDYDEDDLHEVQLMLTLEEP